MNEPSTQRFPRAHSLEPELPSAIQYFLKYNPYEIEYFFEAINLHRTGFLRRFRDPIRVPRIENRVPRISENCHRVPGIRENRVPRIREIGYLQIHTGYLTFSFKKTGVEHWI